MISLDKYNDMFTESGQRILQYAFVLAQSRNQNCVEVEHIIKAIADKEPDLFNVFLRTDGIDPVRVSAFIEKHIEAAPHHPEMGNKIALDVLTLFGEAMKRVHLLNRTKIEALDLLKTLLECGNLLSICSAANNMADINSQDSQEIQQTHRAEPIDQADTAVETFSTDSGTPDPQWRAWVFVCICLFILLGGSFFGLRALNVKAVKINQSILNPQYEEVEDPRQNTDPITNPAHAAARYHDYNFTHKSSSSDAVLYLRQKQFRTKDVLLGSNYDSLYCFLNQLHAEGRVDDEYDAFKTWLQRSEFDPKITWGEQRYILGHIESMFTYPLSSCLENAQFGRAKTLAHEGARRVRLIDLRSSVDPYVRDSVNKILLYEAILWRPNTTFGHPREIGTLFQIITEDFNETMKPTLSALEADLEIAPMKIYMLGVYQFRAGNLDDARVYFRKVSEAAETNPKLKDLSNLMQARCVFWAQRNPVKTPEGSTMLVPLKSNVGTAISELKQLASTIKESKYVEDIQFYIKQLEKPQL